MCWRLAVSVTAGRVIVSNHPAPAGAGSSRRNRPRVPRPPVRRDAPPRALSRRAHRHRGSRGRLGGGAGGGGASRRWTGSTYSPRSSATAWPTSTSTRTSSHATEAHRRSSAGWPATSGRCPARWTGRNRRAGGSLADAFRPVGQARRAGWRAGGLRRARIWEHCWERDSTNDTRILVSGRTSQPAAPPATCTVGTDQHPSDRQMPPHKPDVNVAPKRTHPRRVKTDPPWLVLDLSSRWWWWVCGRGRGL